MPVVPVFPDGMYDHSHAWQNANDRVAWERTWKTGTDGQRKMAQAALTADPAMPAEMIRANMTTPVTIQAGTKTSPTIDDVLNVGPSGYNPGHLYDRAPTDFSGTPAGMQGSSGMGI